MASYITRLYLDTGFSPDNIPDSASLLDSASVKYLDVDAVWLYQNQEVGAIRVKANFDSIYPVDYCRIGLGTPGNSSTSYYFVTGITMLNPTTAQVNLQIDAVTTIGLNNITDNIVGGWCIRRHVNNDDLFSNNIEEKFLPAEPLVIDFKPFVSIPNATVIIASTVDLDKVDLIAKTFKDSENNLSVTVPQMPTINEGTIVNITPRGGKTYTKTLPTIRLYDMTRNPERYSNSLSTLWSLGMIDSITAIYNISGNNIINYLPSDDIGISGGIVSISFDGSNIDTDSTIPIKWSYNANNNKVYCDQFNKINVASFTSGDELDYNPSDIVRWSDNTFQFVYWHDPSPNGKTYIRPIVFQGLDCSDDGIYFQCITGSTWLNTQVSFEAREGWAINKKLYGLAVEKQGYAGAFNLIDSFANIGKMVTGASNLNATMWDGGFTGAGYIPQSPTNNQLYASQTTYTSGPNPISLIDNAKNGINLNINKRQNRINYIADNALVSPTIKFPRDNSLIDLIGNGFFIIRSRLSDNDSQRFDKYLTEYGYAVNEPLTKECFYGRQYFNYIEATEVNIKTINRIPLRLKQIAIEQLEGGVRIWHTLVNANAYNSNPIVS